MGAKNEEGFPKIFYDNIPAFSDNYYRIIVSCYNVKNANLEMHSEIRNQHLICRRKKYFCEKFSLIIPWSLTGVTTFIVIKTIFILASHFKIAIISGNNKYSTTTTK